MNSDQLLRHIPDDACHIEVRGMLLSRRAELRELHGGLVARHRFGKLVAVMGEPSPSTLRDCLAEYTEAGVELLAQHEQRGYLDGALPGWRRQGARIYEHRNRGRNISPPARADIRWFSRAEEFPWKQLPEDEHASVRETLTQRDVVTAWEDDQLASIASSWWHSETRYDISIDTLPAFRRRRHGTAAVSALIHGRHCEGLQPVWGAMDDNEASIAMARRLGFELVGRLWLYTPN